jgi:hypothetical protein
MLLLSSSVVVMRCASTAGDGGAVALAVRVAVRHRH